jgi:hypothetical protein
MAIRSTAMSYVVAAPEYLASAAKDVSNIGSTLTAAHAAAAVPTTQVAAAAQDEVSAAIASLFAGHGQAFQALSAPAAAFHAQFAQTLSAAGGSYTATEAANTFPSLRLIGQGAISKDEQAAQKTIVADKQIAQKKIVTDEKTAQQTAVRDEKAVQALRRFAETLPPRSWGPAIVKP